MDDLREVRQGAPLWHRDVALTDSTEFFLVLDRCPDCRSGSYRTHGMHQDNATTGSDCAKTLDLMATLPPELQIKVAARLDLDTLFNSRHSPHFEPLWDAHKSAIYDALHERYRTEADVFPFAMLMEPITDQHRRYFPEISHVQATGDPVHQYYLHLDVFSDATDAVIAFLKTELSLSETSAREMRPIILVLWRIFGTTPGASWRKLSNAFGISTPEFLCFFASLGQPSRRRVMRLMRELSTRYEELFPFDYRAHGITAEHQAEMKATEAPAIIFDYFMLAYLRYGMRNIYRQVSLGSPANAAQAFNRRTAPWTISGFSKTVFGHFGVEAWYETDLWSYKVFFDRHRINFSVPFQDGSYDPYRALRAASDLPGYELLDWEFYIRLHQQPGDSVSWQIPRPFVEYDEDGAPLCPGVKFPF